MQWYYAKAGQQLGPVERAALERLVASGQVQPADLVWNESMPNWQPASTVPEINGLIPANLPPSAAGNLPYVPPGQYPPMQPAPGQYAPGQFAPGQFAPGQASGQYAPAPGYPAQQPLPYGTGFNNPGTKSYQGLAIGGFVSSVVGLVFFLCFGYLLGLVGLVLGVVALNGMKTSGNQAGRGMALAAVIIGICDLLMGIGFLMLGFGLRHH